MFAALRRCPATLSRNSSTAALACRALRTPMAQSNSALRIQAWNSAKSSLAAFHSSSRWRQMATAESAAQEIEEPLSENGPVTEFADLATRGLVHPNIVNTITKQMRLTSMTDVQTRTINEALSGVDVIAQAKTGTGKTLGFLIPVIQRIIAADPKLGERVRGYKRARPDDIKAIIISPTRELAEQIAVEAQKVVSGTGIVVQTAVGGTQKNMMLRKTQREGCHLLIGTPGRIHDILSDDYSGIKAPKLAALVMDEADRLLDQGFTEEIEQIKTYLPDPEEVERQNLMFSATIPRDVIELVRRTLRPGFHFARCVDENAEPTHERVPQKFVNLAGFENIAPTLYELVQTQHQKALAGDARPFKAIVYFNSTAEVSLASSAFYKHSGGFKRNSPLHGMLAYEIHAKLSQAQRTRAADDFRNAKSGLLFSSDVTARGMDFPNVTHVIQVGLPRDRESYIHRLGRTARAGKEGEGWLLLTPYEKQEAPRRLRALPLQDATEELECASVDMTQAAEVPANVGKILADSVAAHQKVYPDKLDAAFKGLFGSFQWYGNKRELIEGANRLAEFGWGMNFPPPVPSSVMSGGRRGGPSRGGYGDRDRNRGGFGGDRRSRDAFDDRSGGASQFGGARRGGDRGSFGGRDRGGDGGGDRGGYGNDRRSSGGFGGQRREPRDREFTERY